MNKDKDSGMDIFDRIMHRRFFRRWETLYIKHKEVLLYLFFGGLSFLVSIGSFSALIYFMQISELFANIWSWVCAVTFAYFTNRTWVFEDKATTKKGIFREIYTFFSGRVFTLVVEEALIYIFIIRLGFNAIFIKTIAQIIVIVLNYVISKTLVFRKRI